MQAAQQRLWPDPQPLIERLGRDFFRQLPATPGVYLLRGRSDSVLYVGKAKNLRHRLGSYRVANPERMARRTLRLLNLVAQIAWEECEDEPAALRRESELLLTLKPRFNRAGVWPGPRRFVAWRSQPAGLELAVTESAVDGWNCAGPFGAQAAHLHRALVRLLWCRFQPSAGLAGMPAGWFGGGHGKCVVIPHSDPSMSEAASRHLANLASGEPDGFHQWLLPVAAPFEQRLRDEDLEWVTDNLVLRASRIAS